MNTHRYCVIMCGGIGSRFWPYSRQEKPKQFIDLLGTGKSLLQMTYERLLAIVPSTHIVLVTNERYADMVHEQLPQVASENILLEPARRNTAPTVTWAAHHLQARDPEAVMMMTPSDHLITGEAMFAESVTRGFEFVERHDALLTLGVKPTRPETGYGYIQVGTEVAPGINHVKTFTEKPPLDVAAIFVETGEFYWNSGIFMWKARDIIAAMRQCDPDLADLFDRGGDVFGTAREMSFIRENFPACPANSVDYAVMEVAKNVYVECVPFGWSDLGTWNSLYENSCQADQDGNVTKGCELIANNSHSNIFVTTADKQIVVDGLDGYIVADAGDVLLICPRERQSYIKQMVNDVRMRRDDKQ